MKEYLFIICFLLNFAFGQITVSNSTFTNSSLRLKELANVSARKRAELNLWLENQKIKFQSANDSNSLKIVEMRDFQLKELEEVLERVFSVYKETLGKERIENAGFDGSFLKKETDAITKELQEVVVHNAESMKTLRDREKQALKELQSASSLQSNETNAAAANGSTTLEAVSVNTSAAVNGNLDQTQEGTNSSTALNADYMVKNVMGHVADAADEVEEKLKSDAFGENMQQKGSKLETVVKVGLEDDTNDLADAAAAASKPDARAPYDSNLHVPDEVLDSDEDADTLEVAGMNTSNASPGIVFANSTMLSDVAAAVARYIFGSSHISVPMLIDSDSNAYVLSRSSDLTLYYEDNQLVADIAVLLISCFATSLIMSLLNAPPFFGHVLAGIVTGPMGLNLLQRLVQLETIGNNFGVMFIMFLLGMEFHFEKIRRTWKQSLLGTLLPPVVLILLLAFGNMVLWNGNAYLKQSITVGTTVSLSSTIVLLKVMQPVEFEYPYGRFVLGVLVMQDVLIGALLALLPVLRPLPVPWLQSMVMLVQTVFKLLCFALFGIALCYFLLLVQKLFVRGGVRKTRYALPNSLKLTSGHRRLSQDSRDADDADEATATSSGIEFAFLAVIALTLWLGHITQTQGVSLELGCFVSGLVVGQFPYPFLATVQGPISHLRDFFACFFFASIGFHINLLFFLREIWLLLLLTMCVVIAKSLIVFALCRLVLRYDFTTSALSGVALCNISEFAFILAARMKKLGIVPREAYYLILGTATLSMTFFTLFWSIVKRVYSDDISSMHHSMRKGDSEEHIVEVSSPQFASFNPSSTRFKSFK